MSLNRQGEVASPQHRYDLSMGSDKSSSLSRSEGGVYDVVQAEIRINNQTESNGNIVNNDLYPMNGHSTLDSRDGSDSSKRRVRKIMHWIRKSEFQLFFAFKSIISKNNFHSFHRTKSHISWQEKF